MRRNAFNTQFQLVSGRLCAVISEKLYLHCFCTVRGQFGGWPFMTPRIQKIYIKYFILKAR